MDHTRPRNSGPGARAEGRGAPGRDGNRGEEPGTPAGRGPRAFRDPVGVVDSAPKGPENRLHQYNYKPSLDPDAVGRRLSGDGPRTGCGRTRDRLDPKRRSISRPLPAAAFMAWWPKPRPANCTSNARYGPCGAPPSRNITDGRAGEGTASAVTEAGTDRSKLHHPRTGGSGMRFGDPELTVTPCPACGCAEVFTAVAPPGEREMPLYPACCQSRCERDRPSRFLRRSADTATPLCRFLLNRASDHGAVRFGHCDKGGSFRGMRQRPPMACGQRGVTYHFADRQVDNHQESFRKRLIHGLLDQTFGRRRFP